MRKFIKRFTLLLLCAVIVVGIWHGITFKNKMKVFAENAWEQIKSAFKKSDEKPQDEQKPQEEQDPAYFGIWGENISENQLKLYGFSKSGISECEGFIKNEVIYAKDMPNGGYACSAKVDEHEQTISFVWVKDINVEIAFVYDIAKDEMSLANGTKLVRLENVENHVTDFSCRYDWTITKEATCKDAGTKHGTCSICGHEKDFTFFGDHSFVFEKVSDTEYRTVCKWCGKVLPKTEYVT